MSEDHDRPFGPCGKPGARPHHLDDGKGAGRRRPNPEEVIAELRQTALERSAVELALREPEADILAEALAEASRRIVVLEARALAQDRTLRHVMATLIEWIEGDGARRVRA